MAPPPKVPRICSGTEKHPGCKELRHIVGRNLCKSCYYKQRAKGFEEECARGGKLLPPKTCQECGKLVPRQDGGTAKLCRKCYRKTPEQKAQARVRKKTPEQREYARTFQRKRSISKKYGLSQAQYEQMLVEHGGFCGICREHPLGEHPTIDHCHVTGAVRGLLCSKCNTGLGLLSDSVETLKKAILYLENKKDWRSV